MKPSATDIMALLRRIEAGEVTLTCTDDLDPHAAYFGMVHYRTSDGWSIEVFNDCDKWDYLESVTDPSGDAADFNDFWADGGLDVLIDNAIDHPCCYVPTYLTSEIWGFG